MSFGRYFREIMSVVCPLRITVRRPSIKDISDKREKIKGKRPLLLNDIIGKPCHYFKHMFQTEISNDDGCAVRHG